MPTDYYVFMQDHKGENITNMLNIESYTIVDTGDDFLDMKAYSMMEVVLQGDSTYAVIACLVHPGKIIVTNKQNSRKYKYDYKEINRVVHWTQRVDMHNFYEYIKQHLLY